MSYSTYPPDRDAFIEGLRELAAYLAQHPTVPVPKYGAHITLYAAATDDGGRGQVNHIACLLNATTTDDTALGGHYRTGRDFGPIHYGALSIPATTMAIHEASSSYYGCVIPDTP